MSPIEILHLILKECLLGGAGLRKSYVRNADRLPLYPVTTGVCGSCSIYCSPLSAIQAQVRGASSPLAAGWGRLSNSGQRVVRRRDVSLPARAFITRSEQLPFSLVGSSAVFKMVAAS